MDNREILKSLKERARQEPEDHQDEEVLRKYVLFSVGPTIYALPAEEVREISFDNEIYYVPFLPAYIRGYANRHGLPLTVLDIQLLFEKGPLESGTLLILDIAGDQLALLISDVDEILKLPESAIHSIASTDDTSRYFAHSVAVKDTQIFVLAIDTILERLERDVERI